MDRNCVRQVASIRPGRPARGPKYIALGNEKGGSGKSTTAIHIVVALMRQGRKVGCIDLDARQGTLSRLIENRRRFIEAGNLNLKIPDLQRVYGSDEPTRAQSEAEERRRLDAAVACLGAHDVVVIDTPGGASHLSSLGHRLADILITPMNDSFLDLDVLAEVDQIKRHVRAPSVYAQMVWEQRQARAQQGRPAIDWLVMRNRLSHVDSHNKREIADVLERLKGRFGFRLVPGLGERVIFRELFPKGLTMLDLREAGTGVTLQISHIAARQEVRRLLEAIGLGDAAGVQPLAATGSC